MFLPSCTTAPITERKQLKIISEARLNAQAAQIYKKVKEKDLVVKIAKRLKSLIDNEKSMRAILILDDDSYTWTGKKKNYTQIKSLNERITRAKNSKADLLISIHADSFKDSKVRGATLYALSDSKKIAKGDNYKIMYQPKTKKNIALTSGVSKRVAYKVNESQVQATAQSTIIAEAIISEMKKDVRMRKKTPIEAQFDVLKSTEIASVLL